MTETGYDQDERCKALHFRLQKYENFLQNLQIGMPMDILRAEAAELLAMDPMAELEEDNLDDMVDFLMEVLEDNLKLRDELGEALEDVLSRLASTTATYVVGHKEPHYPYWIRNADRAMRNWQYLRDAGKDVSISNEEAEKILDMIRELT